MSEKVTVEFVEASMPYRVGDVAGFTKEVAERYIDAKKAKPFSAPRAAKKGD